MDNGKGGWRYVMIAIAIPLLIVAVVLIVSNLISFIWNSKILKIIATTLAIIVVVWVFAKNKNWFDI